MSSCIAIISKKIYICPLVDLILHLSNHIFGSPDMDTNVYMDIVHDIQSLYWVQRYCQLPETCMRTCIFYFSTKRVLNEVLVKQGDAQKHSPWSVVKNTPVLMLNHTDFVPQYENKSYELRTKGVVCCTDYKAP